MVINLLFGNIILKLGIRVKITFINFVQDLQGCNIKLSLGKCTNATRVIKNNFSENNKKNTENHFKYRFSNEKYKKW